MDGNSQQDTYFVTLKDFLENQARLEAEQRDLDKKKILNEVGRRNFDGLIKDLLYREAHGEDISQELRSLQAVPNTRIGPLQVSLPSLPPRTIQAPPASTQGNRPNVSYASTANWQPYQSGQSSSSSWPRQGNSGSSYTTHPPTNPYRAAAEQYNSGVIALVSPQVQQAQYQNSTHPSAQQQYVSTHGAQSSNTTTYYPPPVRAAAHYSSASALPGNTSSLAGALGEPTTLNAQPPVDPAQTAQSATPGSATINSSTNHAPSNTVSSPQQIYSEEAALRLSARYKEYIQGWAQNAPANSHFSVKGTTFTVYKDHGNRVWVVMPGKKSQVYAPIGRIDEIFSKYFQACRRGIYEDRNGTVATFNGTLSPEMRSKWHIYFDPIAFNIAGPDVIQIGRQAEGSTLFPSEGTATSSRGGTTPTGSQSTPVTAVTTAPPAAAIRGYPSSHTTTTSIAPSTAAAVVPVTPKSPPPAPVSLPKEPDGLHTAGSSAATPKGTIETQLTATLSHQPHTAFVPSAPGPSSHVESDLQSHDAPLQRPMQHPPTALDAIPDQSGFDLTAPPKEKTAIKQKLSGLVGPGKYLARDILIALGFTAQGQKRQLQDDDVQENPAKRRAIEAPVPQPLASSSTAYFTPSTSLPVVASVQSPSLPPVADIAPRSALPQSPVHSPEAAKIQHPIPTSIVATPVQPSPPLTASEAIPDEPQVTNDNIYIPDEEKVPSVRVTPPEREIIVIEDSPTPPASNHATPPPMTPPTLPTSSPSPNAKRPQVPLQARQKTPSTTSVSTGPDLSGRPSTPQSQARKSYSSSPEQVQTSAVKGKQKERKHPSTDRSSLDVDLYQSRSAASTSVSGGKVKDSHKSGFRKETSLDIARLRSPSLPPPPPAALGRTSTMERNIARSLSPLDLQYLPLPATRISAASTHQGQQHQQHVPLFLPSPSSSRSSLDMIRPSYHTDEHRESSVELMDMTEDGIEVRRYPIVNTAYVQVPPRPAYLKKHLAKKSEPSKSKSVARRRSISEVALAAEFENFGVASTAVDPEVEEVVRLAKTRLYPKACSWNGCDCVLNSDERLLEHVLRHQADAQTKTCLWRHCGQSLSNLRLREHLSGHTMRSLICPYLGCEKSFHSSSAPSLLRHTKAQHPNGTLKLSIIPFNPKKVDEPPEAPHSMPSYMIESRHIIQHTIAPERHAKMGPWVLLNITGPVNLPTKRYNAAVPLRKRWSVDENGEIRRPEMFEYEFLKNTPSPFSMFPSKPATLKNLENLDSCRLSQMAGDGLTFWPDPEGRLFLTLDEGCDGGRGRRETVWWATE